MEECNTVAKAYPNFAALYAERFRFGNLYDVFCTCELKPDDKIPAKEAQELKKGGTSFFMKAKNEKQVSFAETIVAYNQELA